MQLTEVLNNPYDVEYHGDSASFKIPSGATIKVELYRSNTYLEQTFGFYKEALNREEHSTFVGPTREDVEEGYKNLKHVLTEHPPESFYGLSFSHMGEYRMVNHGSLINTSRIMATVAVALKNLLAEHDARVLWYIADKKSRVKAYNRLMQRYGDWKNRFDLYIGGEYVWIYEL